VVLGSYFGYFDRVWPEKQLSSHHSYIRSRREQAQACIEAGSPGLEVMVLEVPYVFGVTPGRTPMWAPWVNYLRSPIPVVYPKGGANFVSVETVGEAIVGAIEQGKGGEIYAIGDENMTYAEWLRRLSRLDGRERRILSLPTIAVRCALLFLHIGYRLQGKENGIDHRKFADDLVAVETYFDPTPSREALGYDRDGLEEAMRTTGRGLSDEVVGEAGAVDFLG
jgi:nucleoside-diphosphate-sugar epimerase